MPKYRIGAKSPQVAASAFVAHEATLVGDVHVAEGASVWFGAVLRGDNEPIRVGAGSNVQEGAVLHADPGYPLTVGQHVTVGHQAMLHGCTLGDGALVGIQAVVLNGAVIGADSLVGAGAVVTERKTFPPRSLIVGAPAQVKRELTQAEVAGLRASAQEYVRRAAQFAEELERVD
ncbi:gamma carbonic anhydrase family protein [Ramlibacter rhizophilus]|uniref:Gamma carbonic anhydrase family protein n=1 Tax=Ramlibacter rhizophilus TaxID=1781167 RepID=A0A4Z0BN10_9BURK|nr:gamma carbonic anhydrase family protein [Ramlibacter rhizophilus]TFY99803.1 gamma carbonic anhydrase family protein [Ramlibacter rhizophilus]